ncbi:hypothetical protein FY528_18020 [Hymenobacter lutimineralis]|uniref:Lipoprotein n=1 Tax=Hymenobacter lutimineralis TaxID=2606448 RepID=A0A5D6URT9_9BACT|nr:MULTISPECIES: hypothetical protein [Hymenobacter]QIX62626.1 hypothetical protein HER32_16170 [Hymenobacter sp. BT18]TYZ06411.1 hypothetical protein FY528_18020 [Hymenobacter lutimineralis]
MAPRFSLGTLLVGLLAGLGACCGSTACDCQDAHADAFYLQFSLDSAATGQGFRAAELDTIQLIRRTISEKVPRRADTVQVVRSRQALAAPLLLERTTPFPARDTLQTTDYTYSLLLPKANPAQRYELTDVVIDGGFEADGCCTCYQNRKKSLRVDGQPYDVVDPAANNGAVPIKLVRK